MTTIRKDNHVMSDPKRRDCPLVLQPKDLRLSAGFEYRFIRTDQIVSLILGPVFLEKRLRKLWEHAFERYFLPVVNGREPTTRDVPFIARLSGRQFIKNDKADPQH